MLLWVLLWIVLVLAGLAVLGLLGWRLWRKGVALTKDIGAAGDRLAAVAATLGELSDQPGDAPRASPDRRRSPH